MESFSQKYGYKPVKTVVQVDGMDQDLRNGLWNALDIQYLRGVEKHSHAVEHAAGLNAFAFTLWVDYFKKPLDTMPVETLVFKHEVREYFFKCEWFEVYDFIQFTVNNHPHEAKNEAFVNYCNEILKREVSGYRFIGKTISPIIGEEEIAEIEEVLRSTDSLNPVVIHLKSALDLFSDRDSPDYRNSIKESISAVEVICNLIVGKDKATLGEALRRISEKVSLHPALQQSFSKLYGYTSNADGIRHSLLEVPDLDFEDAKFMLVSCSAFINYLKVKASKAEVDL